MQAQGPAAGQGYAIESAYNGLCLDVSGGNCKNDAKVILFKNNNQMNQTWAFAPIE